MAGGLRLGHAPRIGEFYSDQHGTIPTNWRFCYGNCEYTENNESLDLGITMENKIKFKYISSTKLCFFR